MDANELRVDNWITDVYAPEGKMFQVKEIHKIRCIYGNALLVSKYENLKPIVLSPEILEKCGFELNRNNELSIEINDIASHLELMRGVDGFYYPSFTQTPQGDEERTVYFNRINSLHQLQNLYFSLCGEELTYKQ